MASWLPNCVANHIGCVFLCGRVPPIQRPARHVGGAKQLDKYATPTDGLRRRSELRAKYSTLLEQTSTHTLRASQLKSPPDM
jgi:hypothetical protein